MTFWSKKSFGFEWKSFSNDNYNKRHKTGFGRFLTWKKNCLNCHKIKFAESVKAFFIFLSFQENLLSFCFASWIISFFISRTISDSVFEYIFRGDFCQKLFYDLKKFLRLQTLLNSWNLLADVFVAGKVN